MIVKCRSNCVGSAIRVYAFTLIELLAVIAVISILMAILIPVLQVVSQKTDEAECRSNLRTLGPIVLLYAQDHKGHLPYVVADSSVPGSKERHWRRELLPYVGLKITTANVRDTPFICPTLREIIEAGGGIGGLPSYGMNKYLENIPLVLVSDPAKTLLATEAKLVGATPSEQMSEGSIKSAVPGGHVHRGGQNILYVDGHIDWFENANLLGDFPYASGDPKDVWSPL